MRVSDRALVSVVIPTYNYGQYVCDAVRSALGQTYRNLEVIVVDDGSTDETRQRLEPYGERIRYIYQNNRGLSAARNAGINAAAGEWIALLDSDDMWASNKVERQIAVASDYDWDVVICWGHRPVEGCFPGPTQLGFDQLFFVPPCTSSWLVRAECFRQVGLFGESLRSVEDRDMLLRIGRRFRIGVLCGDYVTLRQHPGSMSTNAPRMKENFEAVVKKALSWPELAGRPFFRAMVKSYVHWDAAKEYMSGGRNGKALCELAHALRKYPLPARREYCRALGRARLAAGLVLRLAGLWHPDKRTV